MKPIQDRIHRSRLTIKYRTNIDGVPVPQTLPLRLLVLADLTGRKETLMAEERRFENRSVVSVKKGMKINDVIRQMNISIPVPRDDRNSVLADRARVAGTFDGTNGSSLLGRVTDIDDNGKCPIGGTVHYAADLYDNDAVKLRGDLLAAGTVTFATRVDPRQEIKFNGPYPVKILAEGQAAVSDLVEVVPDKADKPGKSSVMITAATAKIRRKESPAQDWIDGALTGKLEGTLTRSDAGAKAVLHASGTVTLTPTGSKSQNVTVSSAVPLKNTAAPVLDVNRMKVAPDDGSAPEFDVAIDVPVASGTKLTLATSGFVSIKPKAANAEKIEGEVTGTLEGVDGTHAPGKQTIKGTLSVTKKDGTKVDVPVTGAIELKAGGPKWELDATEAPFTLEGDNDLFIDAEVKVKLGDLIPLETGNRLKIGRAGEIKAPYKVDTIVTLQSAAPKHSVHCRLQGVMLSKLQGIKRTTSGADYGVFTINLQPSFININETDQPSEGKLDGSVEVPIEQPRIDLKIAGAVEGKPHVPGVNPDDVDPITADVDEEHASFDSTPGVEISDEGVVTVRVKGNADAGRTIPVRSLESFAPDALGSSVPEIRRLRILRLLLKELKTDLNMSTNARKALAEGLSQERRKLPAIRRELRGRYPMLALDETESMKKMDKTVAPEDVAWFQDYYDTRIEEKVVKGIDVSGDPDVNHALVKVGVTNNVGLAFHDKDTSDQAVNDAGRIANALAVLLMNGEGLETVQSGGIGDCIDNLVKRVEGLMQQHSRYVLSHDTFRELERNWRDVAELCAAVEDDQVIIDLLDVSKEELREDLADHSSDIFTSALFKKVYVDEYDRFGGQPFGSMLGLYQFGWGDDEIAWLTVMSQIANAAHCPFISSVAPSFFGEDNKRWSDLDTIGDVEAHLKLPKFGKWNVLRDSLEAPYIGLALPGYLSRKPWREESDQLGNRTMRYEEKIVDPDSDYLWGNAAVLFAKNMIASFEGSGWCQYVRGPKGGGLVRGMTVDIIKRHGQEELQSPVQFEIADYRELQFSKAGLMPLVHCKGTSDAAFFSSQSAKKPHDFMSEIDTQNSYLITNLSYTLSITRIAHYVKRMMRDYIGSSANDAYIQNTLQLWLNDYITTTVNPDDLTLRYYPFKAVSVEVIPKPGPLGWYKAVISILPHIQFEGMDVELRLEAALGGK